MIIDGLLQFDAPLSAITVTRVSTNVIDLLNFRDIGYGNPTMWLWLGVNAAFTAGGAGTLQVQLQGSVDNSTYVTLAETRAFSIAELTPIAPLIVMAWPTVPGQTITPRYLRLNYIVATGPMTAGSVNAQLVLDPQFAKLYPAGVTISN